MAYRLLIMHIFIIEIGSQGKILLKKYKGVPIL